MRVFTILIKVGNKMGYLPGPVLSWFTISSMICLLDSDERDATASGGCLGALRTSSPSLLILDCESCHSDKAIPMEFFFFNFLLKASKGRFKPSRSDAQTLSPHLCKTLRTNMVLCMPCNAYNMVEKFYKTHYISKNTT